jgi:hypothetical protein
MLFGLNDRERALLAGGEAGILLRAKWFLLKRNSRVRAAEEREIAAYRRAAEAMPRFRELPPYFQFDSLAEEMKANIRLGVEAGECVASPAERQPLSWQAAVVFASLTLLMISGYWFMMPRGAQLPEESRVSIMQDASDSPEPAAENDFLVVLDPADGIQSLSGPQSSLQAQYVDPETGQLTITQVYVD